MSFKGCLLAIVLLLCLSACSAFLLKLKAGTTETFFSNHVDGEYDLYDLRLRYDLVEPEQNHVISCKVHTPQRHLIHSAKASHSSMMHRPRETGLYELTFHNDMNVDVNVFFEFETVSFGHRMYPGHAAADVSVHRSNVNVNKGEQHTLDAHSDEHIVFLRFDLDSIPSEYYLNDPNFWYASINATLQLHVKESDAPGGKGACKFKHHYVDPDDHTALGKVGGIVAAHAEKADYRNWKWNENELTYANRPVRPADIGPSTVPCRAGRVVEVDVTEIVTKALHAPHLSREITFEISSATDHWVKFWSRNTPEEYKKPHLNIALFPTGAMKTLMELSEHVFTARADQVYYRMREREHRNTVESGNATSFWLEVMTWVVSVLMLAYQLSSLKSFVSSQEVGRKK